MSQAGDLLPPLDQLYLFVVDHFLQCLDRLLRLVYPLVCFSASLLDLFEKSCALVLNRGSR